LKGDGVPRKSLVADNSCRVREAGGSFSDPAEARGNDAPAFLTLPQMMIVSHEKARGMVHFYCPQCWHDFPRDVPTCPICHLDIRAFWQSKDWVDKLVIALGHPEHSTALRAAWLLGKVKDSRSVRALGETAQATGDVYLAREAVRALAEIDGPEARKELRKLVRHRAKMVRDEAELALRQFGEISQSGTQDIDCAESCSRWRVGP